MLSSNSVTAQPSGQIKLEGDTWNYIKVAVYHVDELNSFKFKKPFSYMDESTFDVQSFGFELGTNTPFVDFISVYYLSGENPNFNPNYFNNEPFSENAFVESINSYGIALEQAAFPLLKDESGWKFFINSSGTLGISNYSGILRRDSAKNAEVENFTESSLEFSGRLSAVGDFAFGSTKFRLFYAPITLRFGYGRYSFSAATFGASLLVKVK